MALDPIDCPSGAPLVRVRRRRRPLGMAGSATGVHKPEPAAGPEHAAQSGFSSGPPDRNRTLRACTYEFLGFLSNMGDRLPRKLPKLRGICVRRGLRPGNARKVTASNGDRQHPRTLKPLAALAFDSAQRPRPVIRLKAAAYGCDNIRGHSAERVQFEVHVAEPTSLVLSVFGDPVAGPDQLSRRCPEGYRLA